MPAKNDGMPPGTVVKTPNGYYREKLPDGRWKYQHRIVAEIMLGRPLAGNERATFKNGVVKDPTPDDIFIKIVTRHSKRVNKKRRGYVARKVINMRWRLKELEDELAELNTLVGRPPDDVSQPSNERE